MIAPRTILGGDVNQIKFILVLFNLIFSLSVLATESDLSVYFGKDGTEKVDCEYVDGDYYKCANGKRQVFVKYADLFEHSPVSGFEIDASGKLRFFEFEKFKVEGKLKTVKSVRKPKRPFLNYVHGEKELVDNDVQSRLGSLDWVMDEVSDSDDNLLLGMEKVFDSASDERQEIISKLRKSPAKFDVRGTEYSCSSPATTKGECLVSACENLKDKNKDKTYLIRLFQDDSTGEFFRFSIGKNGKLEGAGYASSIDFKSIGQPYVETLGGLYTSEMGGDEDNQSIVTEKMRIPRSYQGQKAKFKEISDDKNLMTLEAAFKFCPKSIREKFSKAKDKTMAALATEKMVQIIERTNDELRSDLVNSEHLPAGLCRRGKYYYEQEAEDEIKSFTPKGPRKTISMKQAMRLFKQQKRRSDIAWNHIEDGCYARAHLMTRAFDKQKISTDKIWVRGDLEKRLPNGEVVKWDFHVAPIVYVRHKGKAVKMVIDPSISKKPVTVDKWLKEFDRNTINGQKAVQTTYPMPENPRSYGRSVIAYSNMTPMSPNPDMESTEQDRDEEARDVMDQFLDFE